MEQLSDYLDKAKEETGSDYKTAQQLNLTRAAISKSRKTGEMSVDNAVNLAQIIGTNPAKIIAACNIAKHPENAEIWGKWVATICLTTSALSFAIQGVAGGFVREFCILC